MNVPALPIELVRDLLGITRALYRACAEDDPRRAELEAIGKDFRIALDLARRGGFPSVGNSAAWARSQRATEALGKLIGESDLSGAVRAMAEEMKKRRRAG